MIKMVWEAWLTAIAPSLDVTASQAGIIISFLVIFAGVLMVAMAAPKHASVGMSVTAFIGALFFTYVSWLPVWTGTALSFVLAIIVALVLKNAFGN